MDSQGNPVPLKKKKDGIKIGVMLLTFNDFNLDQETESGLTAFKESLLTAKGYKLVKVNYSEFNTNFKLYEKVQYLQRKFEAVYTN